MSRRFVAREGSCWTLSSVLHVLLRLLLRCGVVRRISAGRSLVSCLVLRFSRLQWRQQFGLLVRAQSAWWSCGCGLSEVSAYGAYESSAVLLSMAVSASRLCLVSPTWRSGSALRRPGHGALVLDGASPQPAFLGLFGVRWLLPSRCSILPVDLRGCSACFGSSGNRGNEVNATLLRITSMVENGVG
ncbi:hypothetical protein HID58_037612 [Brassica napus]|uniref:Secreted protein n=1 Tax=Brassica napus TaxID=3708 RepID=A0ABQ8BNF7_BRANA|nr:hypothetical protein HID58_037612 [Brassica napus]